MARRIRTWLIVGVLVLVVGVLAPTGIVWVLASNDTFEAVDEVPQRDVTIVLGAGVRPSGEPSAYLKGRLDLAADLYDAGRTKVLLLSGGSADYYNEPEAMQRYLVNQRGIPAEHLVLDPYGADTYTSCVRAKKVFGVNSAIVVTQRYHLNRSVATCQIAGIDVDGIGDVSVGTDSGTWRYGVVRELGANIKMAWDFTRRRQPAVMGPADDAVAVALANR
ncbi:SanA/YdcF family protein [Propionibacteriaceae bacterium Y1923]|uniref:SanA/YdcF family protein n=1 Tax=Aestuariimicrobium sp. Y1814 TaxID=3418742 RepID=UPI003C2684A3